MNIIFPILETVSIIPFNIDVIVNDQVPGLAEQTFTEISWSGTGLFQIISGWQLISSVYSIR